MYSGHSPFLAICGTWEKIMSFHDNGFPLLRFACGYIRSSIFESNRGVWVDWKGMPLWWIDIPMHLSTTFIGFSLLVLWVMNFDWYLATYYPIFHRTSVTKGKFLTLLTILDIGEVTLPLVSSLHFISFSSWLSDKLCFSVSPNVNHQLQTVYNCQEKSDKRK